MSNPTRASGSRPATKIEVDRETPARRDENARRDAAEDALYKLERFLESWIPSKTPRKIPALNPPRKVPALDPAYKVPALYQRTVPAPTPPRELPAPFRMSVGAGQLPAAIGIEPPAPGSVRTPTQPRRRRPVLKAALLAWASVGAYFGLDGGPGLQKLLHSIAPSIYLMAKSPPRDEIDAGPANAFLLLPKEDADSGSNGASSEKPPASPKGLASFDNGPPAGPAGYIWPRVGAWKVPAEAPLQPKRLSPAPDRAATPPEAPVASPAPAAATKETPPVGGVVKAPAEPEPKPADNKAGGAQRPGPLPGPQLGNHSRVGQAHKPNATAVAAAPQPPTRPAALGKSRKRKKTAEPHKAAEAPAETPAPPAATPEAPAPQPPAAALPAAEAPGNPLLRLMGDAFK